ncbi:MAG: hypothetical protein PHU23_03920 [Dehalococcoidales bacterium]|nr:hypothetical protein [Dehalococcoidales bacterium]
MSLLPIPPGRSSGQQGILKSPASRLIVTRAKLRSEASKDDRRGIPELPEGNRQIAMTGTSPKAEFWNERSFT